jgi:hypothetical protein
LLPGTKKEPHENGKTVCARILADRLNMSDAGVQIDYSSREEVEGEPVMSPSYPGVLTVYRREIYDGSVEVQDPRILQRISATRDGKYSNSSEGVTRQYQWMTEMECMARGVMLKTPKNRGDISALVHAPIGFDQEELLQFLESCGVDPQKFGQGTTRTLRQFSDELVKGEATLDRMADGRLCRVVDIVLLVLSKQSNGDILVEAGETVEGIHQTLNRLPGAKRRSDENQFLAAGRVITEILELDENFVNLEPTGVLFEESEGDSSSYPGVKTFYRKRIIFGTLNDVL